MPVFTNNTWILGLRDNENGKMLCSHCVIEYEKSHESDGGLSDDFEPIELDGFDDDDNDDKEDSDMSATSSRIHSATAATLGAGHGWDDSKFSRPTDTKAPTAIRCRTFHSKLTDSALRFMDDQINGWGRRQRSYQYKVCNINHRYV